MVNGQIVVRPIMVVALTYDHRLLDGREAVTFLGVYFPFFFSYARVLAYIYLFFLTLPFVSACKFPGPMKFVCMELLNFAACSQGAGLFGGSQEDAPCLGLDMIHAYRTMTAIYTHTYCFSSSTETWTLTRRTYH